VRESNVVARNRRSVIIDRRLVEELQREVRTQRVHIEHLERLLAQASKTIDDLLAREDQLRLSVIRETLALVSRRHSPLIAADMERQLLPDEPATPAAKAQ
jgi:hypothetical protein